ncbi:HAMP domain-containing histidine kinase [Actinoplanes sp. TBRC 11911]|uniref:sensor histidine kinase n=1 Tax=Actinoplanes sp. TBRC 11911 TaxID=2729386 RepID=UPI00145D9FFB|nr:HAMP domain-containing sensor histidine kinase [Actinoplanes sp. TBRC 11911]NMO54276.1 HAMP domain-containing histidine kinase [Actinoplanes sp. TBRC 11911]
MPEPRSLLVKLLVVSAVVSLLSVAATAWLAVRTTARAIQQEQGQALSDDARIYDALLGYAATHPDWSGVGTLLGTLSRETGHRVTLTDRAGTPIAGPTGALPGRASATVDPLSVDAHLRPAASDDRIDPRAVGPFRLPTAERTRLHEVAGRVVRCLRAPPAATAPAAAPAVAAPAAPLSEGRNAEVVDEPSGRPRIETPGSDLSTDVACAGPRANLAAPTATEKRALDQLDKLVNGCLARRDVPAVLVGLEHSWVWADPASVRAGASRNQIVADCVAASRREQLAPFVASAALLFVTTPGPPAPSGFDLSPVNRARIIAVTAAVLLVAVGVTTLVGVRLVRPLRALTTAAGRMRDGDGTARVAVTGRDEIARLGAAFNDMAERRRQVEELRRAMVGDVAHEMRTPVTNIRGWLEAAEDGVVPLDRELMSSLLEEALLLQHVIDDLQDLSAADAGELRLHPQLVNLAELLPAVVDAFAGAAGRAGVALVVHAPAALVTADPIRLRQAVGNLVTNAIRHTPAGGRVTVSTRTEEGAQVIDVADTGPGLSDAERTLVFERFWRAEKSRSRQTGGSGLGLSIVRKLIEAHGGTATVTSEPGAGATFTLRLPR